jgi:tetratricopeptide (TPR) repeat protein
MNAAGKTKGNKSMSQLGLKKIGSKFLFLSLTAFLLNASIVFADSKEDMLQADEEQGMNFFSLYGKASELLQAGSHDEAVNTLETALRAAQSDGQKAMVHKKLADIYDELGEAMKELEHAEKVPELSQNSAINEAFRERVELLREELNQ